jgi:hypothetical protein
MLTLEYNGLEKSFADWGIDESGAVMVRANMAPDTFTVAIAGGPIEGDAIFPFEAWVIIRSGRSWVAEAWTGGVIEFQGKRVQEAGEGRPDFEGVAYQFMGPWYDVTETAFQQTLYSFDPNNPEVLIENLTSDVTLFMRITGPGTREGRNNGQTVSDILQHVLEQYADQGLAAPFQIGGIGPNTPLNIYQARDVKCSEAIHHCLRSDPDACVWFDYTTQPPTVNVTKRAAAAAVVVAFADAVKHESIRFLPRPDLQARAVVLYFKQTHESNGAAWMTSTKQKHGPNGANNVLDPEGGLRVLVQTIDLQGGSRTDVFGELYCYPAVPTSRDFWKRHAPQFASYKVRGLTFSNVQVKDENGVAVNLAGYANMLEDGCGLAPWMKMGETQVVGKRVTITAEAAYKLYAAEGSGDGDTSGRLEQEMKFVQVSARGTVTNGIEGAYSALQAEVEAEAIPAGLAQKIFENLALLQYEGEITLSEEECATAVHTGNVLNITGGRAEWATMKAQIQSVRKDFGTGRTSITVGPAKHLSAGDLTELFLINRNRRYYFNADAQATGRGTAAAGSVTMAKNAPKENTTMGLPKKSFSSVSDADGADTAVIKQDGTNQKFTIEVVNSAGVWVSAKGRIEGELSRAMGTEIKIREAKVCEAGGTKYCLTLASLPYADKKFPGETAIGE